MKCLSDYKLNIFNGFIRKLPPFQITANQLKDLKNDKKYIAGVANGKVFIGDMNVKNKLLSFDLGTADTITVLVKASNDVKIFGDAVLKTEFNRFYLMDGMAAKILSGDVSKKQLIKIISTPNFTEVLPISTNSFLFRRIDNQKHENVLVKQNNNEEILHPKTKLLKKQVDGLFCTDGLMAKVPNANKIFYVYYYRNQIICLDTNLNLLYTKRTVDTVSHAKITVAKIKSSNEITMASPPLFVNKQVSATEKYLFLRSMLKADNETVSTFEKVAVIDVYDVENVAYQFSFYLPDLDKNKLTDFKVFGNTLVALFGRYLYTFKLNF
ncbi:hypothetical protein CPT03_07160 [Pedobacter ginsengisoli]|uniref:Uncharacterized protein n=1 Tax=Pedobacter ginsengisoli TaxID=363852 RepID=A0A2D1U401_9SPHI|nr:hypothetical protein CPT03_07160 [Pedobacter ginsengisoli]